MTGLCASVSWLPRRTVYALCRLLFVMMDDRKKILWLLRRAPLKEGKEKKALCLLDHSWSARPCSLAMHVFDEGTYQRCPVSPSRHLYATTARNYCCPTYIHIHHPHSLAC